MSSKVLLRSSCFFLVGFCALLVACEKSEAQSRTWHYNSNNYAQPASLPWYYGAPSRRPLFGRRAVPVTTPVGVPAVLQPTVTFPSTGCSPPVTTTNYAAPSQCASTCTTGGYTQTVGYVPQTVYRTVYRPVPVTQYQPVAACGPCGQAVTTYKPVTTYVHQAQRVAHTSYLAVPTVTYRPPSCTVGCATVACGTSACATGACGVRTTGYYNPSSCSTCATTRVTSASSTDESKELTPTPALKDGEGGNLENTFNLNKPITDGDSAKDDEEDLKDLSKSAVPIEMGHQVDPIPLFESKKDKVTQSYSPQRIRTATHTRRVAPSRPKRDAMGWKSVSGK